MNATTGELIWNYTTGGDVVSSPAVANGIVCVGSHDGKVYALNAYNGAFIWSYTTGDMVVSSPVIVNGVVYIGSYDHVVYAIGSLQNTPQVTFTPMLALLLVIIIILLIFLIAFRYYKQRGMFATLAVCYILKGSSYETAK